MPYPVENVLPAESSDPFDANPVAERCEVGFGPIEPASILRACARDETDLARLWKECQCGFNGPAILNHAGNGRLAALQHASQLIAIDRRMHDPGSRPDRRPELAREDTRGHTKGYHDGDLPIAVARRQPVGQRAVVRFPDESREIEMLCFDLHR